MGLLNYLFTHFMFSLVIQAYYQDVNKENWIKQIAVKASSTYNVQTLHCSSADAEICAPFFTF